ncbi:flagellar hook-basal body protein [Metabacillus arenae]|uniref:Flagellar hook-basal body protein n=1 Tax=Metabacillus arenae TaxID=2771434 RepID=A0A926RY74_9BACI|nr:flagellar hook-basal body protein [Metabacillus arenae]MBD1382653.1 flagellar hook-basal body protein [Metabacillus arenae]
MLRSMITATNTMGQLQKQLDIIGNNMANIDTTGFKRTETSFGELVRQQITSYPNQDQDQNRLTAPGLRQGVGALLRSQSVFTQGSIKQTDRELDIALTAPGQFLQVEADGEMRYTRDDALYLTPINNNQVTLVNTNGNQILDENQQPIILDNSFKEIQISQEGILTAVPVNASDVPQTANLGIVKVENAQMLSSAGENLFQLNENADGNIVLTYLEGELRQTIGIKQKALETSNVDMAKEMTDLMISQRSYQMNARSISMGDQMLGLINSVR